MSRIQVILIAQDKLRYSQIFFLFLGKALLIHFCGEIRKISIFEYLLVEKQHLI